MTRVIAVMLALAAVSGCQVAHDAVLAGNQRDCERTPDARAAVECRERLGDQARQTRAERDRAAGGSR